MHNWNWQHVLITFVTSYTGQRILTGIVQSMPPLPANANWWEQWLYKAAHVVATPSPSNGGSK